MSLFKKKTDAEATNSDQIFSAVYARMFPGGDSQLDDESRELYASLDKRYPLEDISKIFLDLLFLMAISRDRRYKKSFLETLNRRHPSVSSEDGQVFYEYIFRKMTSQGMGLSKDSPTITAALAAFSTDDNSEK